MFDCVVSVCCVPKIMSTHLAVKLNRYIYHFLLPVLSFPGRGRLMQLRLPLWTVCGVSDL